MLKHTPGLIRSVIKWLQSPCISEAQNGRDRSKLEFFAEEFLGPHAQCNCVVLMGRPLTPSLIFLTTSFIKKMSKGVSGHIVVEKK